MNVDNLTTETPQAKAVWFYPENLSFKKDTIGKTQLGNPVLLFTEKENLSAEDFFKRLETKLASLTTFAERKAKLTVSFLEDLAKECYLYNLIVVL